MEEIDEAILDSLNGIGCHNLNGKKLIELDQDDVYQAISFCLLKICPAYRSKIKNTLPKNMGDRFRICTLIADQIKNLGYRGDIGYQTILYGNVVEIRRVLMFLTEKLPKEKIESQVIETENLHQKLLKNVASSLQMHSKALWTPLFCERYNYEYDGEHRLWYPTNVENVQQFETRPILLDSKASVLDQTKNESECLTSVLENNALLQLDIQAIETHDRSKFEKPVPSKRKPKLPPKPNLTSDAEPIHTIPETIPEKSDGDASSNTDVTSVDEITVSNNDAMLRSAVEQLQRQIVEEEISIRKTQERLSEKQNAVRNLETEMNTRKRFVDLLPNIDENCDKLKEYINNSDARSSNLMSQWEAHRRQLISEIEVLKNEKSVVSNYDKLQNEILQSSKRIEALETETVEKRAYLARLQNDFKARSEKQPKNSHRNFYVKRILEIVANVKKQREEIDKVLSDVNARQKEINSLSGKLERTFQATDQLMFEDAKKDDHVKCAYRTFLNIHEACAEISAEIDSSGQILREIRDLEDQIDLENQNAMDKKLEKLISDLCEIRDENEKLERKLAREG